MDPVVEALNRLDAEERTRRDQEILANLAPVVSAALEGIFKQAGPKAADHVRVLILNMIALDFVQARGHAGAAEALRDLAGLVMDHADRAAGKPVS